MDHEKFLDIVKRMLHFEKIFKIKLEETPDFSHNAIKEFTRLTGEISKANAKLEQLYDKYAVKKSEVERYLEEKSLFEKAKLVEITSPTHYDWMVFF
jgi:predicted nucleotidyltransferase